MENHIDCIEKTYLDALTTAPFDPNGNLSSFLGSLTIDLIIHEVMDVDQISQEVIINEIKVIFFINIFSNLTLIYLDIETSSKQMWCTRHYCPHHCHCRQDCFHHQQCFDRPQQEEPSIQCSCNNILYSKECQTQSESQVILIFYYYLLIIIDIN